MFGISKKQIVPKTAVDKPSIKYRFVKARCSMKFEVCATREARMEDKLLTTDHNASATYMSIENTPVKIFPSGPEFSKKYK